MIPNMLNIVPKCWHPLRKKRRVPSYQVLLIVKNEKKISDKAHESKATQRREQFNPTGRG